MVEHFQYVHCTPSGYKELVSFHVRLTNAPNRISEEIKMKYFWKLEVQHFKKESYYNKMNGFYWAEVYAKDWTG